MTINRDTTILVDSSQVQRHLTACGFKSALDLGWNFCLFGADPDCDHNWAIETGDEAAVIIVSSSHHAADPETIQLIQRLKRVAGEIRCLTVKEDRFIHASLQEVHAMLSTAPIVGLGNGTTFDGEQLLAAELVPQRWRIENVLPEVGLGMLAGQPKAGKSWLSLQAGLAIASGQRLADWFPTTQCPVLIYALEDSPSRLQSRLKALRVTATKDIAFKCNLPSLDDKLIDVLRDDVEERDARFVIIDPFVKIKGQADKSDLFKGEYRQLAKLKEAADDLRICILLVHHFRKSLTPGRRSSGNQIESFLGTTGLTAAPDSLLGIVASENGNGESAMSITPRDAESQELLCTFDLSKGGWKVLGDKGDLERQAKIAAKHAKATQAAVTNEVHQSILKAIRDKPMAPIEIARLLKLEKSDRVRCDLKRLKDQGRVISCEGGLYLAARESGGAEDQEAPEAHLTSSGQVLAPLEEE